MCYWLQHIAKENPTRRKVSSTLEKERDVLLAAAHREGESDAPQSEQHARKGGMCYWLQHTAKENPTRRNVSGGQPPSLHCEVVPERGSRPAVGSAVEDAAPADGRAGVVDPKTATGKGSSEPARVAGPVNVHPLLSEQRGWRHCC